MKGTNGFGIVAFGLVVITSGVWISAESGSDRFAIDENGVVGNQHHDGCTPCCTFTCTGNNSQCVGQDSFQRWCLSVQCSLFFRIPIQPAFWRTPECHFPIVKNSLSPTSPRPGLIIPRSFICPSRPPTQTSTDSLPFSSAALLTPSSLPSTLITTTFFTPHSSSVCMAALEVPPVAITGSRRIAIGGIGNGSGLTDVGRWYGRLL